MRQKDDIFLFKSIFDSKILELGYIHFLRRCLLAVQSKWFRMKRNLKAGEVRGLIVQNRFQCLCLGRSFPGLEYFGNRYLSMNH